MNILFTSVGRRVELVQAFKIAAERMHIDLRVFGADISNTAPALYFCDETVMTPKIKEKNYIPFLIDFCDQNHIDALIPTIDTDLLLLAENRDQFGKTRVLISTADKIKICRDKRYTADYFHSLGLKSPQPIDDYQVYEGSFPAFIKPKNGSSSISAYKVNSAAELETYAAKIPDYIVQPFVEGTEYTVDAFCDFEGNPILITPRIRLAVRAGEVLKTRIEQDDRIIHEIQDLIADFRPCGPITVQLIRDGISGEDYYIEINPRFGGGAPLSIKAGADSAEALLRLLNGEKVPYRGKAAEDGAIYSRFDQSVRIQ